MQPFTHINANELRDYFKQHQEEKYQLVDVRQPDEYKHGHIAGATLLPLGEISARLSEIPQDREIIFY